MTNLYEGRLTDLLQNLLSRNPEVRALAYAVLQEKQRIMDEADGTRTMAMVDQLPEEILDVLAMEIPSPYYRQDMTLTQKREIVKGSLRWFMHAGTAAALTEMTQVVFGSGGVVEWFDFDPNEGEIVPGEFDLETGSEMQDPTDFIPELNRIIGRIKNVRSHLRNVRFLRNVHTKETAKVLPETYPTATVRNVLSETVAPVTGLFSGGFAQAVHEVTIRNVLSRTLGIDTPTSGAGHPASYGTATII